MDEPLRFIVLLIGFAFVFASIIWFAFDLRKAKRLLKKAETEKDELRSIISDAELMVDELNNFSNYLLSRIDQKNSEAGEYLERLDESMYNARNNRADDIGADKIYVGISRKKYSGGWRKTAAVGAAYDAEAGAGAAGGEYDAKAGAAVGDAYGGEDAVVTDSVTNDMDAAAVGDMDTEAADENIAGKNAVENMGMDETGAVTEAEHKAGGIAGRRYKSRYLKRYAEYASGRAAPPPGTAIAAPIDINDWKSNRRGDILSRSKKNLEVMRCSKLGMTEAQIAKTLNIGRGEVALIIALCDKNAAHGNMAGKFGDK